MAITALGAFAASNSTTGAATFAFSPTVQLNKGEIGVLIVAQDNRSAGADGDNKEVPFITDSKFNTWQKAREFGNTQAAAAGGACVGIWWCLADSNLLTGDTITVTFGLGSNVTSKAAIGYRFSVGAGNTFSVVGGVNSSGTIDAATVWDSLTLGSLANSEHLWVRACAKESNVATDLTVTATFTLITGSTANSGVNTTSMAARGEFVIATATTETSLPTDTFTAADIASTMVAFDEVAIPAGLDLPNLQPSFLPKDNRARM